MSAAVRLGQYIVLQLIQGGHPAKGLRERGSAGTTPLPKPVSLWALVGVGELKLVHIFTNVN